jgi:hypothetical protein
MVKQYGWNLLISLDQLLNTLLGGHPDETLSSRMGKYVQKGRGVIPCVLCKILDVIFREKDHCIKNIESDRGN